MTHEERARAVYDDWRERCIQNDGEIFISNIGLMEQAIVAALQQVEAETARRCAEIAESMWTPGMTHTRLVVAQDIRAAFPEVQHESE